MIVEVKTNANKTEILEETPNKIKLAVKAKPEGGKANLEVMKFLSKHFKKNVEIVKGKTSKKKIIKLT